MRLKPYTAIGIMRLKCFRCGQPARTQWNICADLGQYRPLCVNCDISLNRATLQYMGFCDLDVAEKMNEYEKKLLKLYGMIDTREQRIEVIVPKRNAEGVALLPASELDDWE